MYLYPDERTNGRTGGKLICPPTLRRGGIKTLGLNSGAPEWQTVHAPLVAPVVLVLLQIRRM